MFKLGIEYELIYHTSDDFRVKSSKVTVSQSANDDQVAGVSYALYRVHLARGVYPYLTMAQLSHGEFWWGIVM